MTRIYSKEYEKFKEDLAVHLNYVRLYILLMDAFFAGNINKNLLSEEDQDFLRNAWNGINIESVKSRYQIDREFLVTKIVDSFQHYLSKMLRRVFVERPEILKSEGSIKIKELLEYSDMNELIGFLADRKVNELAYSGLPKVIQYLKKDLGLNFDTETTEFKEACELIEVRNIIVHNDCKVSDIFLRRTSRTDLKKDEDFPLTPEYANKGSKELVRVASTLDLEFLAHFKLKP